jgi:hypothetical protein
MFTGVFDSKSSSEICGGTTRSGMLNNWAIRKQHGQQLVGNYFHDKH